MQATVQSNDDDRQGHIGELLSRPFPTADEWRDRARELLRLKGIDDAEGEEWRPMWARFDEEGRQEYAFRVTDTASGAVRYAAIG